MASSLTRLVGAFTVATALVATPGVEAFPGGRGPTLEGRAVLPAGTTATGPPAGAFFGGTTINGISFPRPAQPVAGFSAVVPGRVRGEYLAMPDNGFGNKANSADFLIRAYFIRPDFTTARRGSGSVAVGDHIEFRDPHEVIGFPIVQEGTVPRLLTGADIDPESLQRAANGDYWMGDEFGPWLLHFDAAGILLDPPFPMPGGLRSPSNPLPGGAPNHPGSRGVEALALTPDGKHLYAALEGPTDADTDKRRRLVFEFSVADESFTGDRWVYRTDEVAHLVADMAALDRHRLVVIERDGGRGETARFRNLYVVDRRRTAADRVLGKRLAVDLTRIADPDLVSLPAIAEGDLGLGDPFWVMCESVEAVHPVGGNRLLVGCDNNLPNTGRNPGRADDNELIVVKVPGLRAK